MLHYICARCEQNVLLVCMRWESDHVPRMCATIVRYLTGMASRSFTLGVVRLLLLLCMELIRTLLLQSTAKTTTKASKWTPWLLSFIISKWHRIEVRVAFITPKLGKAKLAQHQIRVQISMILYNLTENSLLYIHITHITYTVSLLYKLCIYYY